MTTADRTGRSLRLLVLGGTTEASRLAQILANRSDIAPLLSLAGRTARPILPTIPHRVAGFGGPEGLAGFLRDTGTAAVVDATHPFAARISLNAVAACEAVGVPLAAFTRPPWSPQAGDRWTFVPDMEAAAAALGPERKHVLLTTGRLEVSAFRAAPQHDYLVRTIDPPDPAALPPACRVLLARPPFSQDDEVALMRGARIEVLVTKNGGDASGIPKLVAARTLGVRVVMVERPPAPDRLEFTDLDAVMAWIAAQRP